MQYIDLHPSLAECLMWAVWALMFHFVCWIVTKMLAGF